MSRMVTQQQLADLLQDVNVEEVAKAAGVSTKTIYRLRHQQNFPNMATVVRLLDAIKAARRPARKAKPAAEAV